MINFINVGTKPFSNVSRHKDNLTVPHPHNYVTET
ncbi:hypothetical protein EVJ24_14990 [Exiguobacterium sp. SH1S21]|nr:hypothetical protein EVJ24_14990 [Exiguobacterium sp. SH1S21]